MKKKHTHTHTQRKFDTYMCMGLSKNVRRQGNTMFEKNFTAIHMHEDVMIATGMRDMI